VTPARRPRSPHSRALTSIRSPATAGRWASCHGLE
jgi:hypothetical protein